MKSRFNIVTALCVVSLLLFRSSESNALAFEINSDKRFILAVYLPWYTGSPTYNHWKWIDKIPPSSHASAFMPLLGLYDNETDESIIKAHIMQIKAAGINAVIINWYGKDTVEDRSTKLLVKYLQENNIGFAIMVDDQPYRYSIDKYTDYADPKRKENFTSDIKYIRDTYFSYANYLKLNGKPMLENFSKQFSNTDSSPTIPFTWWRDINQEVDFAFIGQIVPKESEFVGFNKGAYGWVQFEGNYAENPDYYGESNLKWFLPHIEWRKTQDLASDFYAIPAIYPGFDDSGVYSWTNDPSNKRVINRLIDGQKTLDITYQYIKDYNQNHEKKVNSIQLVTFNDWNEGSQIEASLELGMNGLKDTARIAKDFGVVFVELNDNHFSALEKYLQNIKQFDEKQKQELENLFFSEKYDYFTSLINVSEINMDATSSQTINVSSPIRVTWDTNDQLVLQVYLNGSVIYPKNNVHVSSSCGTVLCLDAGETYELKLWRGYSNNNQWIKITNSNPCPPPTPNACLVAHWGFDEPGGTIAFDSVGNVNGTLVGGVTFTANGIVNGAIQITNGYVDLGNNLASTLTFSVQAWTKTDPNDFLPMTPVAKHWAGWGNGYYLSINNVHDGFTYPNLAGFRSMDNIISSPTATGGPVVNDGAWHQLVGVYDNGTSTLYVDGNFVASTYPNGYSNSSVSLLIGGCGDYSGTPGNVFRGLIDEVRIYDNVLSANDVKVLYDNTINSISTQSPERITQEIPLAKGWNLISFQIARCFYDMQAPSLSIITSPDKLEREKKEDLLEWLLNDQNSPIRDADDPNKAGIWQRIISFDQEGAHILDKDLPPFANTLHYFSFGYGYWIKMNKEGILKIEGWPSKSETSLHLRDGWNLIGYVSMDICYGKDNKIQDIVCPYYTKTYHEREGIKYCQVSPLAGKVFISLEGKYRRIISFDTCSGAMIYDTELKDFNNTLYYLGPKYGYWIKMVNEGDFMFPDGCPDLPEDISGT